MRRKSKSESDSSVAGTARIVVSENVKPPAHPWYGDSYERGEDPFHPNCFQGFSDDIVSQIRSINPGPQASGWFLLDTWGHEVAFIPDGTIFRSGPHTTDPDGVDGSEIGEGLSTTVIRGHSIPN